MSQQDARKVTVIEELLEKRLTNTQAAMLLDLSTRQVQRLKAEAAANGAMAVLHKNRGRRPVNALEQGQVKTLVNIYKKDLAGYNFCHARDVLAKEHGLDLSVSTVSRYLKANGINTPKAKRRPKRHRSRPARSCEGELGLIDASRHDWLDNGSYLHLHGAIDDATGQILALHFEKEETFEGYSELVFQMNEKGQLPRGFYSDKRSVFFYDSKTKKQLTVAEELAGMKEKKPQFARAMETCGMSLILANSPQAKGGIERLWGTLQDRLVKDMKRHGVSSIKEANAYLKTYIDAYNQKFAVEAREPQTVYLPLKETQDLKQIFAIHQIRKLDNGLAFSFQGQKYRLPENIKGKKIPASPRDTITVATSRHIGIQVLFKGLCLQPELLDHRPKDTSINPRQGDAKSVNRPAPRTPHIPSADHPWRHYENRNRFLGS